MHDFKALAEMLQTFMCKETENRLQTAVMQPYKKNKTKQNPKTDTYFTVTIKTTLSHRLSAKWCMALFVQM